MISTSHIPFIYDQPIYLIKDIDTTNPSLLPVANNTESTINTRITAPISTVENKQISKITENSKVNTESATPLIDKSLEIIKVKCLKKIWIWVYPEDGESISAIEYEMITKTMAALNKTMDEVSVFVPNEVAHTHFNKLDLKDVSIVDFGMCPTNINTTLLQLNIIHKVRNSCYLHTLPLHLLQENLVAKKEWWGQMKILLS